MDTSIDHFNQKARASFESWISPIGMEDARRLVPTPPAPNDGLDEIITPILERFRSGDDSVRAAMSQGLNPFAQKRLLRYAATAAGRALDEGSVRWIALGLCALAMEGGREELRESIMILAMLFNSATTLGNDAAIFEEISHLCTPGGDALAQTMARFPHRPAEKRDLGAFGLILEKNGEERVYRHVPWWSRQ